MYFILSSKIIPSITIILPLYILFQKINLLNSVYSIIISNIIATIPITIWLMKHFFSKVPVTFEDYAKIEGATQINIWWNILLPQVKSGLLVTFLIIFIIIWNEYIFSLFFFTNETQNLTILLAGSSGNSKSVLIITMVLPLIIISLCINLKFNKNN